MDLKSAEERLMEIRARIDAMVVECPEDCETYDSLVRKERALKSEIDNYKASRATRYI